MMLTACAVILLLINILASALSAYGQIIVVLGWARNNVSGAVFRKNAVVTQGQEQYTACYDSVGYVVLAKRRLPAAP